MRRLLLTTGRGPAECRIGLGLARARLIEEAHAMGIAVDALEGPDPDGHGPASVMLILSGPGTDALARGWIGSIEWLAPSSVRPQHKRKRWFIGVADLGPAPEVGGLDPRDVRFESTRAGGPGGQHQNKTESAVRAVHVPSGLAVVAREERSQARNKALALERLRTLKAAAAEIVQLSDRQRAQAAHDALERGRPIKRFRGPDFVPQA